MQPQDQQPQGWDEAQITSGLLARFIVSRSRPDMKHANRLRFQGIIVPMSTVADICRLFGVGRDTVLTWCDQFSDYLSGSAVPPKGTSRVFSESDLRVLAVVYYYWEDEPDLEYIRGLLDTEDQLEDIYVQFAYKNTPLFQEPPDQLDETWTHGVLISGMCSAQPIEVARAYKHAADSLVEIALADLPPHELGYPIFFMYRHSIEIYLKILVQFGFGSEKGTHSLASLRDRLKAKFDIDIEDWIERRIMDFQRVDPESDTFRYPEGITRQSMAELWVSFPQLKHVMQALCCTFESAIQKAHL